MFLAAGVTRYFQFRELKPLEAWVCRQARRSGKIIINGRTLEGKIGATASHSMYLASGLDDDSRCEVGIVTLPDSKVLDGQAAQGLYEITLREEFARLNELTGSLTLTSGVQAAAGDKSIVDSLEGTVVWEYDSMASPQTIVRLYRGMMKAYVNQTNTYEGSVLEKAFVEGSSSPTTAVSRAEPVEEVSSKSDFFAAIRKARNTSN
jgi:hypothetical protein